jgi:predicted aspartyl protease
MKIFTFECLSDEDVIIVEAIIEQKYVLRLALDTAATHTTLDSNMLYLAGYELKNSKGEVEVETSNGIILVNSYEIKQVECLGISRKSFEIQVYDFLAHGIISNYDGVIGLDFLQNHKICIDFRKNEITCIK